MSEPTTTLVSQVPAASQADALEHFSSLLAFETDCWDVHASMAAGPDFVLADVRGAAAYAAGHADGAVHIPHADLTAANLSSYATDTLFVVYCAGPHCNGADKAARNLAALGRPVKKMIGGVTGWLDDGFMLVSSP